MSKEELIAKLNPALADEFEVDEELITPEASIKETFHIDSLSLVDMIALIEDLFGLEIKNSEIVKIQTFGDLYDYIHERL